MGWFTDNSDSKTHPVGKKKPNAWGFYDMHGNVFEWVFDTRQDYPETAKPDYVEVGEGSARVIRGGSWDGAAALCRAAVRFGIAPGIRIYHLGFRPSVLRTGQR